MRERRDVWQAAIQNSLLSATLPLLVAPVAREADDSEAAGGGWRRRGRGDDHDLFRLFSACTPQDMRWQTALSPGEWRAAQEKLGRGSEEWILDDAGGRPEAMVRLRRGDSILRATVLATERAEVGDAVAGLLAQRTRTADRTLRSAVLVPSHAPLLTNVLRKQGYEDEAQFALSVRPIAQRTQRLQLAERSVEGTVRPVTQ